MKFNDEPGQTGNIIPIQFRPKVGQRINLRIVGTREDLGKHWTEPVEVVRVAVVGEVDTDDGRTVVYGEAQVNSVLKDRGFEGMTASWHQVGDNPW